MATQIKINNIDYSQYLVDGFVITETLTEELDSAVIVLSFIPKHTFDPFSDVSIVENDKIYNLVIDTYTNELVCNEPQLYSYTIQLISKTKMLERIILPNLAITKPLNGDSITFNQYFNKILDLYIKPKIPNLTFTNIFSSDVFVNNSVPEIAWATPNAKQLFNDLLNLIPNEPKLVKVVGNNITAIDISKKRNEIKDEQLIGKVSEESYLMSKDYANSLTSDLKNVIPSNQNTRSIGLSSARVKDSAIITTDNLEWYIPNAKFESITSLYVYAKIAVHDISGSASRWEIIKVPLTDSLVEKSVYNYLEISNKVAVQQGERVKRNYLYYEYGGDTIRGLTYNDNTWFLGLGSYNALETIISRFANYYCDIHGLVFERVNSDQRDFMFEITYRNQGDFRTTIFKSNNKKYDLSLQDNQNVDFINMLAFAQSEREKINRLGNETKIIPVLYTDKNKIPDLGDYIGDYILAKKEVSFYKNFAVAKLTFSKNYLQKNVYYGLNQRTRFTQFAQSGNTLIRDDLINVEISLDTFNSRPTGIDLYTACYFARSIVVDLGGSKIDASLNMYDYNLHPKIAVCRTIDKDSHLIEQFGLQPSIYTGDYFTSVVIKCEDNINISPSVRSESNLLVQDYIKYVDDNGEFKSIEIELYDRYAPCDFTSSENLYDDLSEIREYQNNLPKITSGQLDSKNIIFNKKINLQKDNREITQITMQFDFVSNSDEVVIGPKIGIYNSLNDISSYIYTRSDDKEIYRSSITYVLFYSESEKYQKGDLIVKGERFNYPIDVWIDASEWITWAESQGKTQFNSFSLKFKDENIREKFLNNVQSWAIGDGAGNLIIGVNRNNNEIIPERIYVNITKK